MRQNLVVGNWKMHGSRASVDALLGDLVNGSAGGAAEVAVCPTYVHLGQALELCSDSELAVGAQDCSHMASGAFTGEVSAEMLADLGCSWVILGHSERRQYHGESDALVAAKLGAAVAAGLRPIVCVGEMSFISYRVTLMPHGSEASSTARTIASFKSSRSEKLRSRSSFPSSDRMVVFAS